MKAITKRMSNEGSSSYLKKVRNDQFSLLIIICFDELLILSESCILLFHQDETYYIYKITLTKQFVQSTKCPEPMDIHKI